MQVLLLVLQLCVTGFAVSDFSNFRRIFNGTNAPIEEFPYVIQIAPKGWRFSTCGGSIIGLNVVITAAHCFFNNRSEIRPKEDFVVRSGTKYKSGRGGKSHNITELIWHGHFNDTGLNTNDIAILKVDPPFEMGPTRQSITIAENPPNTGDIGVTAGWGKLDRNSTVFATVLQKTKLPIVAHDDCKGFFDEVPGLLVPSNICTNRGKSDIRSGDSGSPLALNGKLVGIVGFGRRIYVEGFPSVFASVHYHLSWIKEKVTELNGTDVVYE